MYKKILSCLCIGIIFISILNPLKVKAYNDLDTEVSAPLTEEQFHDSFIGSLVAGALETGGSFYIPAGITEEEFYEDIADYLYETLGYDLQDYYNKYQDWFLRHPPQNLSVDHTFSWLWEDDTKQSNSLNMPKMAYDLISNFLSNKKDLDTIEPTPEVNYLPYIELINGKSFNYTYYLTDNWATTLSTSTDHISGYYLISNPSNYSFYNKNWSNNATWNSSSYTSYYVSIMSSNQYKLNESYTLEPISLYINQVENTYQVTTSTFVYKPLLHGNSYGDSYTCGFMYDTNQSKITSFTGRTLSTPNVSYQYSGSSLEDCFKNIAMRWRNVNIYVNGVPWSTITPIENIKVGGESYIPQTNTPVQYKYPDGTYFDPNYLKAIIKQLIDANNTSNGIYIKLDDILDAFTDVNGVTAVYTLELHRTDYDQLIYEQYPIGAIPNKEKGLRLPQEQISSYTDEMIYITKVAGSDMIPNDILTILGACGIMILIAYLINRMLE